MHSGTLNDVRDEQQANIELGSCSILQLIWTCARYLQFQKSACPNSFTVEGIIIDSMFVCIKALSLILVILPGIETCLIVELTS